MAITCPRCGRQFDVTLFQFGHAVECECGAWVALEQGHVEGPTETGRPHAATNDSSSPREDRSRPDATDGNGKSA